MTPSIPYSTHRRYLINIICASLFHVINVSTFCFFSHCFCRVPCIYLLYVRKPDIYSNGLRLFSGVYCNKLNQFLIFNFFRSTSCLSTFFLSDKNLFIIDIPVKLFFDGFLNLFFFFRISRPLISSLSFCSGFTTVAFSFRILRSTLLN